MKSYVKPSIEVISMRTSENIADNNLIKTLYEKSSTSDGTYVLSDAGHTYIAAEDITFSNANVAVTQG